jgi:V/A-type H+-transporting ATPase subunit C
LPAPLGELATSVLAAEEPVVDDSVDAAMFAELKKLAKTAKSSYLARVAELMIDIGNAKSMLRGAAAGAGHARLESLILDGGSVPKAQLAHVAVLAPEEMAVALQKLGPFKRLTAAELLDPAKLDVAMDGLLVSVLREGRRGPTGPEPVIAYVFAREAEVATVRMLLLGKLSGVPSETLRTRLRATYG